MRRVICLVFILVLLSFALSNFVPQAARVHAQGGGGSDAGVTPGEVVVKLTSAAVLPAVASQYKLDPTPLGQFGSRPIYRLKITDGASVSQRVSELLADSLSRVVYAEPNYIADAPEAKRESWSIADSWSNVGDSTAYKSQWAAQKINLSTAHSVTKGKGVTVAVLDTGVDATHPALQGRLVPGWDFVDNDNDPSEAGDQFQGPYGHGTHVAGIIALTAPEAKIMPIRVLDRKGAGNVWVLAEALAYAADPDGDPSTHDGADVINLSLGTLRRTNLISSLLTKVCSDTPGAGDDDFPEVGTPGIVVVAAAGNGGDTVPEYPAAENIGGLLGVASSNSGDALSTFSTRGSWIKVAAPGESVVSSVPGGYGTWNGTSMASPFAAGEAALVRAAFPTLRNTKVVDQIARYSAKIQATVPARIDAGAALTNAPEVTPSPSPTPTPTPTPTPSPSPVAEPYCIGFAQSTFTVSEAGGDATITVTRTSATPTVTPGEATVDFQVVDATATGRTDFTPVSGTLHFAAGEMSKSFIVPITDDAYVEGNESINLVLTSAVGNSLCAGANQATLLIQDNDSVPATANPNDVPDFFVRQHYLDFLSREPDSGGFSYWRDRISGNAANNPPPCASGDAACMNARRVAVSAAFFIELEYQQTGFFVYRFYKASYGLKPTFAQFAPDRSRVVEGGDLNSSKQAFANQWVQRQEFLTKYPAGLSGTEFVDALIQTVKQSSGVDLTPRRSELINDYNLGTTQASARAHVLLVAADDPAFMQAEFNPAFVLTEYFGYLRRDIDEGGYQFWLDVLNNRVPGNYRAMVCAFINSAEYQQRFSPVVTTNDRICGTLP